MSWLKRLRTHFGGKSIQSSDIDMMSCEQVVALLFDYVDDELDVQARAAIDQHVSQGACACKRALLLELAFTDKVRGTLRRGRAPEGLKRRIIESLAP